MAATFDDREDVLIHAPRLFLFTVSIGITTLVATALVGSFDPIGIRHVVGVPAGASGGRGSLSQSDFPDATSRSPSVDPSEYTSVDSSVDSAVGSSVGSAVALVRSTAIGLDVPDRYGQAAIDALAEQIAGEPSLATSLIAVVEDHSMNHRSYVAESVLAALGRTNVGVNSLLELLRRDAMTPRLRGAAFLALVQGMSARPDHQGASRELAYARTAFKRPPDAVVAVFHASFERMSRADGIDPVERERFLVAGASSGAFESGEVLRLLDARGDDALRQSVVSALVRARDADYATPLLRRAWLTDPDRMTRKIAVGALVRQGHALLDEVASFVVDDRRSSAERIDALGALGLRTSFDDTEMASAEHAIDVLGRWAWTSPILRDDNPGPDAFAGPGATAFEVAGRDRVSWLAKRFEIAAGKRSSQLASWVRRFATSDEK